MFPVFVLAAMQAVTPLTAADKIRIDDAADREQSSSQHLLDTFEREARKKSSQELASMSDAKLAVWRKCTEDFSGKSAIVLADSTPTVVDISLLACKDTRTDAEWAWAQSTLINSYYKPDMATAYRWAKETFDNFAISQRDNLLVSVSYKRQIQYIRASKP